MVLDEALREQLAQQDPEFRHLLEEHRARDRRLKELSGKGWLTGEEEQEEKRLKKEKLQLKDQMEALLRRRAS
ncbi:MAG: YdcH family protein [Acidobacteriota bacterium]